MIELDFAQDILGLKFDDPELLQQALTHRSFVNEHKGDELADNERMEFLGDAILDFVVAEMLYREFPDMAEGDLTRLRASLVRAESLAALAVECRLGELLLMGRGEVASGGRERMNNLCSAFEAVIGALYLDSGLEAVREFVTSRFQGLLEQILDQSLHRDARSELQEWSQAELSITPIYRVIGATGPDHDKEFLIEVLLGENVVGSGRGGSKRSAAQSAARTALLNLKVKGWS